MIKQRIVVGRNRWNVIVYYGTNRNTIDSVMDTLLKMGCPYESAIYSAYIVCGRLNTGLTYTDTDLKTSFVCVSDVTSRSQLVNTISHEIKHVQTHICDYYRVSESGEKAAYLVGYISSKIYNFLSKYI